MDSVNGAGDTYDFKFYGYGVTNNLENFYKVEIKDRNHAPLDSEIVYTVKDVGAGLNSGCTVDVTAGAAGEFDVATIKVPKTALPTGHDLEVIVYTTQTSSSGFGTYNTNQGGGNEPFGVWKNYPAAMDISFDQNRVDRMDLLGYKLDKVTSVGLYEVGSNVNLMADEITDLDKTPTHYRFEYKLIQDIEADKEYELRLAATGETTINLPIKGAVETYDLEINSLQIGKTDFYIKAYPNDWQQSPLIGKTINLYSDQERLVQNGQGIFELVSGFPMLKVEMDASIVAHQVVYFETASLAALDILPRNSDFNLQTTTMPVILGADFSVFEASKPNTSLTYDFQFQVYGLTQGLNELMAIKIVDKTANTEKTLNSINGKTVSIEPAANAVLYDTLKISIPKGELILNHHYDVVFQYNLNNSQPVGDFYTGALTINFHTPENIPIHPIDNKLSFYAKGTMLESINFVGLYDKTDESFVENLVENIPEDNGGVGDWGYYRPLRIKEGKTLLIDHHYVWVVKNGTAQLHFDVEPVDLTYLIAANAPVGMNQFFVPLHLNGSEEDMAYMDGHSAVTLSAPNNDVVGTGTVVNTSYGYGMKITLNNGVT
ncbi:hypothetical protein H7X64_01120, partial [Armatimonadetes bacterium]|nr:hypothetical protein [bacterium]